VDLHAELRPIRKLECAYLLAEGAYFRSSNAKLAIRSSAPGVSLRNLVARTAFSDALAVAARRFTMFTFLCRVRRRRISRWRSTPTGFGSLQLVGRSVSGGWDDGTVGVSGNASAPVESGFAGKNKKRSHAAGWERYEHADRSPVKG